MTFSNKALSILTGAIVVSVASGGIYMRLRPEPEPDGAGAGSSQLEELGIETSASQQFSTDVPQPVSGAEAVQDTLWITVTAAGEAAAYQEATLTAQVEGVVLQVPVRENQGVRRGQPLLQIDTTEYALEVAKMESDLLDKQAAFQRMLILDDEVDPDARAARERLARSSSGLNAAEVALRVAQLNLDRTVVRAPFGGRIADLLVVAGQWVGTGEELMTAVDLRPIKVEVQVLEAELGYLVEGRSATVSFAAFPGEEFRGRIETINPRVDSENRTGRVTVLLDNPEGRIKPGMYAQVTIDAQAFADRILIPRSALLERDGRPMVFVYEPGGSSGRAKWRYVTPARENEDWVELVEGDEDIVRPGEVVLVDGHHYLAHDASVRLVENVAREGGRPSR